MLRKLTAAVFAASMILAPAMAAETPASAATAKPAIQTSVPAKHGKASHLRHRHVVHHVRHLHRLKHVAGSKAISHGKQTMRSKTSKTVAVVKSGNAPAKTRAAHMSSKAITN